MNDAAVVAGLVFREPVFLLQNDEACSGTRSHKRHGSGKPDDAAADYAVVAGQMKNVAGDCPCVPCIASDKLIACGNRPETLNLAEGPSSEREPASRPRFPVSRACNQRRSTPQVARFSPMWERIVPRKDRKAARDAAKAFTSSK